jgi:hypothetical protein
LYVLACTAYLTDEALALIWKGSAVTFSESVLSLLREGVGAGEFVLRNAVLSGVFRYRYKNVRPTSVRIRSSRAIEMTPNVRMGFDDLELASVPGGFSRELETGTGVCLATVASDATVGGMSSSVV